MGKRGKKVTHALKKKSKKADVKSDYERARDKNIKERQDLFKTCNFEKLKKNTR